MLTYWINADNNPAFDDFLIQFDDVLFMTSECKMDFANFPFDNQYCNWYMRSQNVNAKDLTLNRISIATDSNNEVKGYDVNEPALLPSIGISFDVTVLSLDSFERRMGDYNISVAGLRFHLQRKPKEAQRLLTSYFFPTGAFAMLSLCSFFIKPDMVPGRMGMLVTSFLIVTGIYNTVDAPASRGFSFIEQWYIGVQAPIIFAILQYGFILAVMKYIGPQNEIKMMEEAMTVEAALKKLDLVCVCFSFTIIVIFNSYFLYSCLKA